MLYIALYENGREVCLEDFNTEEKQDIVDEILNLWSPTYSSTHEFVVAEDDFDGFCLMYLVDGNSRPIPETWFEVSYQFGKETRMLVGDRLPIKVGKRNVWVLFRDV